MRPAVLAVLAPVVVLAACGNPPASGGPTVAGAMPEIGDDPSAGEQLAALQASPVTEPGRLKGLTPLQVKAVLGRPGFTRHDRPAEIWQYRGRSCTLDIFLYDDKGAKKVAHVAVRSANPMDDKACFDELTARPATPPAG